MKNKPFIFCITVVFIAMSSIACKNEKQDDKVKIKVIAHRGDWKNAPENSLQGIKNCIEMGVDMVELDLALTKDSLLVLIHDKTLDRTTTGTGKVSDFTLIELKQLRLKNYLGEITTEQIPTFEEALLLCKDKMEVFIDKGYPFIKKSFQILKETNMVDQAHFLGFVSGKQFISDYPVLHSKVSYMPLVLPTDTIDSFLESFEGIKTPYMLFSFKNESEDYLSKVTRVSSKGYAMATTQSGYYCADHTDSISLIDKSMGWGWILKQGFNAICTDEPKKLIEYLENHQN